MLYHDLINLLRYFRTAKAWCFLQDNLRRPEEQGVVLQHLHSVFEEAGATLKSSSLGWPGPRPFGRHRYVLHAFSSRRRLGDFQHFVDWLSTIHDGFVICTISLDIVVDDIRGDVGRLDTRRFRAHHARLGRKLVELLYLDDNGFLGAA